jgi:hypothetical protein
VKIPSAFETELLPPKLASVKDYIAWVLHKLRDGRPHRLMARHLDNLIPRDRCSWSIVKRWLINRGYIDRPMPYEIGSHAYGFRLARIHRPHKRSPHRGMQSYLIADISLIKKLRRRWTKRSADNYSDHAPVIEAMRELLKRLRLDGQRIDRYIYVRRWGRIYTPVTSLSRARRTSLTLDGKSLVQIDIKKLPTALARPPCSDS